VLGVFSSLETNTY